MKYLMNALIGVVLGLALGMNSAEAAKRLGGGQSTGAQRDGVTQRQAVPPQGAQQAGQAQQPKSGMSRWLGPLAGLAAGLGLAYLLGDQLGSVMMMLLVVAAVVVGGMFLMRYLNRNRQQPAMQGAGAGNSQYTGLNQEPVRVPTPLAGGVAAPAVAAVPPGFDVAGFVNQAKNVFLELQGANDRGDLNALRDMSTDDLFEGFKKDILARGTDTQSTQILGLHAELVEVVNEAGVQWASVRFTGAMRDVSEQASEPFTEIWNLRKPLDGSAGWLLAGIQQA
ncbi:MAG: Tim44 domain-containing protein [Betaproteobacteria bacterium]|nr:Tim44 domain-containing protein [Betaproteobacteria bacterium]